MKKARRIISAGVATLAILGMAACGATKSGSSASKGKHTGKSVGRIALLLPENQTARYEAADYPYFKKELTKICPKCTLDYQNAKSSETDQLSQAEAEITKGADVLVVDAFNGTVGTKIVEKAKAAGIPVESYERLIPNADIDAYISFNNEKVGEAQAQTLVNKLKANGTIDKGQIVMLDGDVQGDANARDFQAGAKKVFQANNVKIGFEKDNPGWLPANAQANMDAAITALGKDVIIGVYGANDPTAGAAITSMRKAGMDPTKIPTTGQDAEVAAIQRIMAGDQYMTQFKPIKTEGAAGADIAYQLLQGKKPKSNSTVNNGKVTAPAELLQTFSVTKAGELGTKSVKDMFPDWWFPVNQVCTGDYAAPCKELGIS